jgi:hypothetical protein
VGNYTGSGNQQVRTGVGDYTGSGNQQARTGRSNYNGSGNQQARTSVGDYAVAYIHKGKLTVYEEILNILTKKTILYGI